MLNYKSKFFILIITLFLFMSNAFSKDDEETPPTTCEYTKIYEEVSDKQDQYILYSLADVITTDLVLSNGGVELNPIGVSGTIFAKIAMYIYTDNLKNTCSIESLNTSKEALHTLSSLLAGAASNNFLIYLGASNPVSFFVGFVYFIYKYNQK